MTSLTVEGVTGTMTWNADGNTNKAASAILYYDGDYVTRCSNTSLPYGRTLPNAWVYGRSGE